MTPESIKNKARAQLLEERFRRRNPGKVPLLAVMLRPRRKPSVRKPTKMPRKAPNLTKAELLMVKATLISIGRNKP